MINSHHAGVCFNFVGRHHRQMFGVKWATYIWVISPGNVQLPINVVVSIILALASLMSNRFLIQTPITIFDRFLA